MVFVEVIVERQLAGLWNSGARRRTRRSNCRQPECTEGAAVVTVGSDEND